MFTDTVAEAPSKEAVEKREDSDEVQQGGSEGTTEGPRPQAFPEPGQKSSMMGNSQAPGEDAATNTQPPASLPNQEHMGPQATGDSERGLSAQQQAGKTKQEEEKEEEEEVREKAGPEEVPTEASSSQPEYEEIQKDEGMYGDRTSSHVSERGRALRHLHNHPERWVSSPPFRGTTGSERGHVMCQGLHSQVVIKAAMPVCLSPKPSNNHPSVPGRDEGLWGDAWRMQRRQGEVQGVCQLTSWSLGRV